MQGYTPQPQPQQPQPWPQQYPPQQQPQYYQQPQQQQQYYPQQQPGMQPPMQQQPPLQPPKPKKNMMIIAVVAIVVVVIVILAAVLLMSGAGTSSANATAQEAANSFYNAANKYDAKAMLELSVDHFAPSSIRDSTWDSLNMTVAAYQLAKVKMTVSNVDVKSQAQMDPSDVTYYDSLVDNLVYTHQITETVTDYAEVTVSYTYTMYNINIPYTVNAQGLMLKIQGKWYAFDPDDMLY